MSYDASVLRHNLGHLAGLFHTTELQVVETDPLSDTPECAQNVINHNPNNCPDVANALFAIANGGTTLTADQQRVIQGSTLYRGILAAGADPEPPLAD